MQKRDLEPNSCSPLDSPGVFRLIYQRYIYMKYSAKKGVFQSSLRAD